MGLWSFLASVFFIFFVISLVLGFAFLLAVLLFFPGSQYLDCGPCVFSAFATVFSLVLFLVLASIERVSLARQIRKKETPSILMLEKGLNEVSGTVVPIEGKTSIAQLSGKACVYYSYKVQEFGPGDWHTVKSEKAENPFLLKDNSGQILVLPEDAEMNLKCEVREKGKERQSEEIICPGDRLFVLGNVGDAKSAQDAVGMAVPARFVLKRGSLFSTFLISDKGERNS